MRHIPNLITVIRLLLVIPIAVALLHHQRALAATLFAVAAGSDAIDGYIARRMGWQSEFGAILDPIADKLLLATVFVTLGILHLVPMGLVAAAVARDAIIVAGALAYRYFIGRLTAHPSVVSKINTLCQAAYILVVVGRAEFGAPPVWVELWTGALVFATIVVSGLDYVMVYARRALDAARGGGSALAASP